MNKQRNQTVDILRGLAMLMVVLGHTMTGCTENSQESFLFNVIWSLQMPLFILISGYVTKYSRPIVNCITYVRFVRKKTFAYLLPWLVWTFVVRGLIFGQTSYLDIKFVMFNMDSGYWFLFTLWTIVMVYGLAQFLSGCICKQKNKYRKLITFTVFYLLGMIGLVAVGLVTGLAFLGIKLTLYYMPFYYVGFLFGQFDAKLFEYKYGDRIKDTMVAVSFACWLALMARFNFYSIGDDFRGIILRVLASMMGCIAVCGLVPRLYTSAGGGIARNRHTLSGNLSDTLSDTSDDQAKYTTSHTDPGRNFTNVAEFYSNNGYSYSNNNANQSKQNHEAHSFWETRLIWIGRHSLEIYMLHGFLLNLLSTSIMPIFHTFNGILLVLANYSLTIALTSMVITIISRNKIINLVCFGKHS